MQINIEAISIALKHHLGDDAQLQIIDESHKHKGHDGYNPEIETSHIAIEITWDGFDGLAALDRHRLVNSWLDNFFKQGLHAARYTLKTPQKNY